MTAIRCAAVALALVITACGQAPPAAAPATENPSESPARREYRRLATVLEAGGRGPQLCHAVAESYPPQCGGPEIVGWDWDAVDGEESAGGTTWIDAVVTGTWDGERFTVTRTVEPPSAWSEPPPDPDEFAPGCEQPDVVDRSAGRRGVDAAVGRLDRAGVSAVWVSDPRGAWDGPFVLTVVVPPGRGDEIADLVRRDYAGALCVVERDQPTIEELSAVQEQVLAVGDDTPLGPQLGSAPDSRRGVVQVQVFVADDAATAFAQQQWGDLVELDQVLRPVE